MLLLEKKIQIQNYSKLSKNRERISKKLYFFMAKRKHTPTFFFERNFIERIGNKNDGYKQTNTKRNLLFLKNAKNHLIEQL